MLMMLAWMCRNAELMLRMLSWLWLYLRKSLASAPDFRLDVEAFVPEGPADAHDARLDVGSAIGVLSP